MNSNLIVANTTIRQVGNLFNLNDLHKASGGDPTKAPSQWLQNRQTTDLIKEVSRMEIPILEQNQQLTESEIESKVLRVVNGGNRQGTYACEELVIAYAMWISPAFHVEVVRCYLDKVRRQYAPEPSKARTAFMLQMTQTLYDVMWFPQDIARVRSALLVEYGSISKSKRMDDETKTIIRDFVLKSEAQLEYLRQVLDWSVMTCYHEFEGDDPNPADLLLTASKAHYGIHSI